MAAGGAGFIKSMSELGSAPCMSSELTGLDPATSALQVPVDQTLRSHLYRTSCLLRSEKMRGTLTLSVAGERDRRNGAIS